jgi:hypothetical protein
VYVLFALFFVNGVCMYCLLCSLLTVNGWSQQLYCYLFVTCFCDLEPEFACISESVAGRNFAVLVQLYIHIHGTGTT